MKHKIKYLITTFILLFTLTPFYSAHSQIITSVPFENIPLQPQPNNTIRAHYSFAGQPIIYCYENSFQLIGLMQWTYQGVIGAPIILGQFSITTNSAIYEGLPADEEGTIIITNSNNTNTTIVVSCQYGF